MLADVLLVTPRYYSLFHLLGGELLFCDHRHRVTCQTSILVHGLGRKSWFQACQHCPLFRLYAAARDRTGANVVARAWRKPASPLRRLDGCDRSRLRSGLRSHPLAGI